MKVVVASSEAAARSASGNDNPASDHFKPNIINLVAKFDVTDDEKAGKALIARVYISGLLSNIERSVEDGYAVLPLQDFSYRAKLWLRVSHELAGQFCSIFFCPICTSNRT